MKRRPALAVVFVAASCLATLATPASAYPTACDDPGKEYGVNTGRVDGLEVDAGDFILRTGPGRYTENFSASASTAASSSTSSGAGASVGANVGAFNAGVNAQSNTSEDMETSRTDTGSTTVDFNVPANARFAQYAGHLSTFTSMKVYYCASNGQSATYRRTVNLEGPRSPIAGVIDCADALAKFC